jgi:aromatic ring hydroxylase
MGLTADKIGGLFTKLLLKGDPGAAMAAGKGPVTPEWAATHGYTQFRTPGMPTIKEVAEITPAGVSLYSLYAKEKQQKERTKDIRKTTRKKKIEEEEKQKRSRLLRRPSRERGIL